MVIGRIGRVSHSPTVSPFSSATRIAVFAPILAVAAVGVRARLYPDAVQPWHASVANNERMLAYAPFLRETDEAIPRGSGLVPVAKIRLLAQKWVQAEKDGTLKPVPPAFYTDSTANEGARMDIERAISRIAAVLLAKSEAEITHGQADLGAKDAMTGYRICEITRLNDLTASAMASAQQRRALLAVAAALPKVSADTRKEAKTLLATRRGSMAPLVDLAIAQRDEWTERYHQPKIPSAIRDRILRLASENPSDPAGRAGQIRQDLTEMNTLNSPEILFNTGRAVANEFMCEDARQRAIALLK